MKASLISTSFPPSTPPREGPLRVLLADDSDAVRAVVARLLELLGYHCDSVANGREVLEALSSREYDAVLMDIQMPELDGLSASRSIRSDCMGTRRPRIIAMTADDSRELRAACRSAGMDAILTKPFRLPGLVAALGGPAPTTGPREAGDGPSSPRTYPG